MKYKIIIGIGVSAALILTLVIGSVWIENRYPSEDARRVLLPGPQRVVTKPIVNALGRQIERYVRSRSERLYMETGLTLEETITRFLDESVDLSARRIHAYRLARVGTPDAIAALVKVFRTAPPQHKAFMAQLIGSTGNPVTKALLWPLLEDANESVALAAIRGLSVRGTPEISARLAEVLVDANRSPAIRTAAALGLGDIGDAGARTTLAAAFGNVPEEEVATQILNSLGKFPYPVVADLFTGYLAATDTPAEMRVIAVEALANSSPDAVPFLLGLAGHDSDPDVRAAAAWAISSHATATDLAPSLLAFATTETDADVRRRLYEALLPQAGIAGERLLPAVLAEEDIAARVAGFNAVGCAVNQSPTAGFAREFDQKIVPELLTIATTANSLNIQMRAVFALRRAQTGAAQAALAKIATAATPQVASAARNGLRPRNS